VHRPPKKGVSSAKRRKEGLQAEPFLHVKIVHDASEIGVCANAAIIAAVRQFVDRFGKVFIEFVSGYGVK